MYFVYALADPRTDQVAYVGITDNLYERFLQHISYRQNDGRGNTYKNMWISSLEDLKLIPSLKLLDTVETEEEAREREIYWIRYYNAQQVSLTNIMSLRKNQSSAKRTQVIQGTHENTFEKEERITNILRQEIITEQYGTKGALPTRTELIERFHTSRDVINRAISTLLAEKLIVQSPTSKTCFLIQYTQRGIHL